MAKGPNRRIVGPHPSGAWQVRANRASRASAVTRTKVQALRRARQILKNSGGGELTIQNEHGRIIDSDTVAPGRDPYPPRDTR
jgi:Uncharacterized protein conserved in bacteria (DUF2188)